MLTRALSVDENAPPNTQEANWRLAVFEEVDNFLLSLPLTDSDRDCHIEELVARHLYKSSLQWHGTQQQLQQSLQEVHDLQQRLADAQHDAMSSRRTSPAPSVLGDHNPRYGAQGASSQTWRKEQEQPKGPRRASSVTSMDVNQLRDALHTAAAESSALRAELAVQTAAAQDAALQAKQERQAHEATKAALSRADLHAQQARQRATETQRRLTEQTQLTEGHVSRLDALGREADGLRQKLQQQRERCGALEAELATLADGFAAQAPSVAALEALLLGQPVPNGDAVVRQQNALLLDRVRVLEEQAGRAEPLAAALSDAQVRLVDAEAGRVDATARAKAAEEQVAGLQAELQAVRDEQSLQRAADVADKMQAAVEAATSNVRDKLQAAYIALDDQRKDFETRLAAADARVAALQEQANQGASLEGRLNEVLSQVAALQEQLIAVDAAHAAALEAAQTAQKHAEEAAADAQCKGKEALAALGAMEARAVEAERRALAAEEATAATEARAVEAERRALAAEEATAAMEARAVEAERRALAAEEATAALVAAEIRAVDALQRAEAAEAAATAAHAAQHAEAQRLHQELESLQTQVTALTKDCEAVRADAAANILAAVGEANQDASMEQLQLQSQLAALETAHAALQTQHSTALHAVHAEWEARLRATQAEHQAVVDALHRDFEAMGIAQELQHASEEEALSMRMAQEHARELDALQLAHEEEMSALKKKGIAGVRQGAPEEGASFVDAAQRGKKALFSAEEEHVVESGEQADAGDVADSDASSAAEDALAELVLDKSLDASVEDSRIEVESLRARYEKQLQALADSSALQITALQQQLAQLKQQQCTPSSVKAPPQAPPDSPLGSPHTTPHRMEAARREAREARVHAADMQAMVEELQTSFERLQMDLHAAHIALDEAHAAAASQARASQHTAATHAREIDALRGQLHAVEAAAAAQAEAHAALRAQHAALELRAAALKGQLEAEERAAAEGAAVVATLEGRLRTAAKDRDACERRLQLVEQDAMQEQMRAVDLEHAFAKAQAQLVSLAEGGRLQSPMPTLMLPHTAPRSGVSSASGPVSIHRHAMVMASSPLMQTSFAATTHIAATPPLSVDDTVVVDNTGGAYRTPVPGVLGCVWMLLKTPGNRPTGEGGQECWLTGGKDSALQARSTTNPLFQAGGDCDDGSNSECSVAN